MEWEVLVVYTLERTSCQYLYLWCFVLSDVYGRKGCVVAGEALVRHGIVPGQNVLFLLFGTEICAVLWSLSAPFPAESLQSRGQLERAVKVWCLVVKTLTGMFTSRNSTFLTWGCPRIRPIKRPTVFLTTAGLFSTTENSISVFETL
jgi:hypothetical protein